jgi:hypothetical protein
MNRLKKCEIYTPWSNSHEEDRNYAFAWMELEIIMLSEINQAQKAKVSYVYTHAEPSPKTMIVI